MGHVKRANENAMKISSIQAKCKGIMYMHLTSMPTQNRPYKGIKC